MSSQACVHFEDFSGVNLIAHAEKGQSRFYQLVLKPKGLKPKRYMTVGQPHAMIEMVSAGFGISIFPRWAVAGFLESCGITARPITRSGLPVTWYAVLLRNSQLPLYQQEFINIVGKMNFNDPPACTDRQVVGL